MASPSVSHYKLIERIGAGGMGEVYRAHDTQLERPVAIKLLAPSVASDEERIRRFVQEAKAASALNHPSILTIYEVGQSGEQHFIAMEFVDGETLRQRLDRGPLDLKQILDIAIQIADGLAAAHAAGIVHRDIKPDNIMLRQDGIAKILDFGLAKLAEKNRDPQPAPVPQGGSLGEAQTMIMPATEEATGDTRSLTAPVTQPGIVMGTVGYMSPEQVRGEAAGHRSDIFSFGCVMYEMAANHRPFEAATTIETLHKILKEQPPAIRECSADTPIELQRIVRKAMAKDVNDRYQNAKDLSIDLRELKREVDSGEFSVPFGGTSAASASVSAISKRSPMMVAAIVAAVVVTVAVAASIFHALRRPEGAPRLGHLTKVTATGRARTPAISADKKYVAYVAGEPGENSVWVKQIATGSSVQIVPPGNSNVNGVRFSPDSNWVLYRQTPAEGVRASLWQVPALGGIARKILDDVDSTPSFSPDGKRMVFARQLGFPESTIVVANADGAGAQSVLASTRDGFYFEPRWSPNGNQIAAVYVEKTNPLFARVQLLPSTGGEAKNVGSFGWAQIAGIEWMPDGRRLLLSSKRQIQDSFQLWTLGVASGNTRQLTNDLDDYAGIGVSTDGQSIVSAKTTTATQLWKVSVTGSPEQNAIESAQITTGTAVVDQPSVSPDGRRIAYMSDTSGNLDIWVMNANGSEAHQLTTESSIEIYPSWSPDGQHIAFNSNRDGSFQLWMTDADGSNARQITHGFQNIGASWSPDSKWITYHSLREGKTTVWKVPIEGGQPVQVTTSRSILPWWSPDGKSILCWIIPETPGALPQLTVIPADGGEPLTTVNIPFLLNARWSPDGKSVTYAKSEKGESNLFKKPLDGKPEQLLTSFPKGLQTFTFGWAHDGLFLVSSRGTVTTDIVMIENFHL